MTDEAQRLLAEAMQLDDERADSLGSGKSPEAIEDAWRIEIQRRLAAMQAGTMPMVSSEDVKRELREIIERRIST